MRTIFTIITTLKVSIRTIIHMNWPACQFPGSGKINQSSTWQSANNTCLVVGLCSCCLTLTACMSQVSTATWHSRYWCDSQLLSPSLLPFAARWESNRKRLYAHWAQQTCENHELFRECVRECTQTRSWTHPRPHIAVGLCMRLRTCP